MSDFCFHLRCESLKLFFSFFFGRNTSTLQHFLACVNKRYGIDLFSLASPKTSRESIQIKIFFFHFLLFLHFFFSSLTALFSLLTSQAVTLARRSSSSRPSKQVQAAVLFLFPFAWHLSTWSKKLLASLEHCSNSASLVSLTENVQAASMSEEHLSSVSRVAE